MAEAFLKPPPSLDFKHKAKWSDWIDRFEFYRKASGLSGKDGPIQVVTLVYTMGAEAGPILRQFSLLGDDEKKYDTIKEKFDEYFIARRNVIFEVCRFRRRYQKDSETAEAFITSLYTLSKHCGFGEKRPTPVDYRHARRKDVEAPSTGRQNYASNQVRLAEQVNEQQPVVRGSQPTPISQQTLDEARAKRFNPTKPKPTSYESQQSRPQQRTQNGERIPLPVAGDAARNLVTHDQIARQHSSSVTN
eukprot:m.184509 g.184509  ORF g.184509 m.184509 type:complete len:247 (+) comp39324_c0_seq2:43-783(+)